MRVLLVDPSAYTLPYDHHLAEALASLGVEVDLVASRFLFGEPPVPTAYRRTELFYPASSRLFGRSRLRLPLKAAEHTIGLARLHGRPRDVLHVQWAPLPQVDVRLMPAGSRAVITAHDVLPRRTADRPELWRRLYGRFARIVVHSEHGRARLVREVGLDPRTICVVPHPVFPGPVRYADDGRTLLFLGAIRPYKQLDHAIEVAARVDARLLVVGNPAFDLGERRSLPNVEWRLGYSSDGEIDRVLAETTIALFPYREELDQSGALLRALGAGVPAAAYDVGGVAEPVRAYGAGVVAPADDLDELVDEVGALLGDAAALERVRAGARAAREKLNWDASARAHLAIYRRILG